MSKKLLFILYFFIIYLQRIYSQNQCDSTTGVDRIVINIISSESNQNVFNPQNTPIKINLFGIDHLIYLDDRNRLTFKFTKKTSVRSYDLKIIELFGGYCLDKNKILLNPSIQPDNFDNLCNIIFNFYVFSLFSFQLDCSSQINFQINNTNYLHPPCIKNKLYVNSRIYINTEFGDPSLNDTYKFKDNTTVSKILAYPGKSITLSVDTVKKIILKSNKFENQYLMKLFEKNNYDFIPEVTYSIFYSKPCD